MIRPHKEETPALHEIQRELFMVEKMRTIIDRSHPRFSGSAAVLFNDLFPPTEKVWFFNKKTIEQEKAVEYTPDEKAVSKAALKALGYTSVKQHSPHRVHAVHHLRVGFSNDNNAYINKINSLPFIHELQQGQIRPMGSKPGAGEGPIITRELHSMHLANLVVRDLLRMAQKDTKLFMQQVKKDLAFYGVDVNVLKQVHVGLSPPDFPQNYPQDKMEAVNLALQYGTYLVLFAYLHDERTPGLGDGVMKASDRFPGQTSIDYSEDKALKDGIAEFARRASSKLPELFSDKNFNLNTDLFVKITQDLASEKGRTLGAQLMKNKRKYIYKEGDVMAEAFLDKKSFKDPASFDLDQASNLLINMYDLAAELLPGGFKFFYKNGEQATTLMPIGSYTDRLMLLMYAKITGMTKENLAKELEKQGISPKRIYIAAEELVAGPNFTLSKIPALDNEIIQTPLKSVSVKRMMQTFAALTYFVYNSDQFSGTERLVQDFITAFNFEGIIQTEMYLNRNDAGVLDLLTRQYTKLIDHIYGLFPQKMERLTEEEIVERVKQAKGHVFFSRAKIFPVARKEGTFVQTHHGAHPYPAHVDVRHDQQTGQPIDNPFSLPRKLDRIEEDIKNHRYFHYIELSDEEVKNIREMIDTSPNKAIRSILIRVLRDWELDLPLSDGSILKKDKPTPFPFDIEASEEEFEQLHVPVDEQLRQLKEQGYVIEAQERELRALDGV